MTTGGASTACAPTRALPGPCRAATTARSEDGPIEFEYDGERLAHASLYVLRGSEPDGLRPTLEGVDWGYDGAGAVAGIVRYTPDPWGESTTRTVWTFEPAVIRRAGPRVGMEIYDGGMFTLLPAVGRLMLDPRPGLGLIESSTATYTWTTEGRLRIRRATPKPGAPADSRPYVEYELDDRGRIVEIRAYTAEGGTLVDIDRNAFDGDRLVETQRHAIDVVTTFPSAVRWTYDAGGNVVEAFSTVSDDREVYAYDCW